MNFIPNKFASFLSSNWLCSLIVVFMIVGKTINCLTYDRRVLVLTIIRQQSQLHEKMDENLFGTGFRKQIVEAAMAKKEPKVV